MSGTERLSPARLADLRGIEISAHQFQQWAPKREEARVIAIGQQVYAVAIHAYSAAAYVDWQADHALSYERIDPPLIRVESSMHEQPGLFDVPTPELAAPPRTGRGRARETYARIVVADVVVQDAAVLRAAALRALDGGIVIGERPGPPDDDLLDPCDEVATSSAAALEWCLEPTAGLWPLLDAGAVQVAAADLAVDEVAAARVRAHWTVTITIRDVRAVRELALAACPVTDMDARTEIERSFAAAWHRAADPYAPMSEIPGVVWTPVEVTIEQVLARSR
jgi:hypothetical protein